LTEDMMMGERDLEVELKEKDEIIMSLRLNEHLLKDKLEISRRNMGKQLERIKELEKKNEQLRKQIQNYEQLISNSYVGEEETLDGFVGKYVIWENELQKYKNKNEMIDNG